MTRSNARKIIFIGLIILGVIGGLWWIGGNEKRELRTVSATYRQPQTDSDNDGLADWEEVLWHSNSKNPDSDGDGTSDGEEVGTGRNPVIPGPNDTLTNPADRVQQLLRQAQKEKEMPLIRGSSTVAISFDQFTIDDLTLSDETSRDALTRYGEQLRSALKAYEGVPWGRGAALAYDFINGTGNDPKATLQAINDVHLAVLATLQELRVPRSAAAYHLDLLNAVGKMSFLASELLEAKTEPIIALQAAYEYERVRIAMVTVFANLNDFFKNSGIIFSNEGATRPYLQ